MDRVALLKKIFWSLQANWHLRRPPSPRDLSVLDTVKGLQALLLADHGALLMQTLQQAFGRPVALENLARLEIVLYQEGADQRVWRAQARLEEGAMAFFGMIAARTPTVSSALTQRDFRNLQALHARQTRYCAQPYVEGSMPVAGGAAAYTVEWLEHHKELVFEITRDGGVFLFNVQDARRLFSPQESRHIWRRLLEILCWYEDLRQVNIQAGDFVGHVQENDQIDLKLTTARELTTPSTPVEQIHTMLHTVITASGYLSDGHQPFDRHMSESIFSHRLQAVLQPRFGAQAAHLARQQWVLFEQGAFAQQEDWLKEDSILATYDRLRADDHPTVAWQETCRRWTAYANAVKNGDYPPSWWFPAFEIPDVLDRLTRQMHNRDLSAS